MNILGMEMRESPNGVISRCLEIGPREAAHLLKFNTHNRKRSATTEERYADDMKRDAWMACAAGIGVTECNEIADGQSRLHAVVQSGATVSLVVTIGLPAASHGVHDRQRKRMLYYALADSGRIPVADKDGVQIATLLATRFDSLGHSPSDCQVADRYNLHAAAIAVIGRVVDSHAAGVGQAGTRAALVMGYELHPEKTREFARLIQKETHERPDHPAFRLRKTLMKPPEAGKGKRGAGAGRQAFAYEATMYALNAWIEGRWIPRVLSAQDVTRYQI